MTIATIEAAPLPDRMRYAEALAEASIIPQAFRRRPADVLVAIEYGNALGIAPIVALSEINVINGTPSLSASLMAALARQAGHKVRVTTDGNSATCVIVRADDPDFEHRSTWDEAKARSAGLWGKGHWGKDPSTMLRWRAISECVRFACSEVLGGIKYTPEEVADFHPTSQPVQHTVKQAPPSITEVVADTFVDDRPLGAVRAEDPEIPMRTEEQSRKLFALMREVGLGGKESRDEALSLFSGWIGRDIGSTKELTKPEASVVIGRLEAAKADAADPATGEVLDPDGGD